MKKMMSPTLRDEPNAFTFGSWLTWTTVDGPVF
jgi:hypothetical protein